GEQSGHAGEEHADAADAQGHQGQGAAADGVVRPGQAVGPQGVVRGGGGSADDRVGAGVADDVEDGADGGVGHRASGVLLGDDDDVATGLGALGDGELGVEEAAGDGSRDGGEHGAVQGVEADDGGVGG